MKKTIIFISLATLCVIIVFGVITGVSFFKNRTQDESETTEDFVVGEDLFFAYTMDELTGMAEEYNLEVESEESVVFLKNAVVDDITMLISYYFDDEKNSKQMIAYIVPFMDEFQDNNSEIPGHTGRELKEKVESVIACLEDITETKIGNEFYIMSAETTLDNSLDASFEKIMSGEAQLHFSLRYHDGTYWCLYSTFYEGHVRFELMRCFDPEMYADSITNITVE